MDQPPTPDLPWRISSATLATAPKRRKRILNPRNSRQIPARPNGYERLPVHSRKLPLQLDSPMWYAQ